MAFLVDAKTENGEHQLYFPSLPVNEWVSPARLSKIGTNDVFLCLLKKAKDSLEHALIRNNRDRLIRNFLEHISVVTPVYHTGVIDIYLVSHDLGSLLV